MSEAWPEPLHEASASGKVVLFGEYTVLEGGSALVWASARQVVARWCGAISCAEPELRRYELRAPSLGEGAWEGRLKPEWSLIERLSLATGQRTGTDFGFAWATLKALDAPSGRYEVDSEAFGQWSGPEGERCWRKLGLGSSAASVASLVSLCAQLKGQALESAERYRLTQLIHHQVQGALGSGVDAAASSYGGLLRYRWQPQSVARCAPLGPPLGPSEERVEVRAKEELIGTATLSALSAELPRCAWVWMGRSASTTSLVRQVQRYRSAQPDHYQSLMSQLSEAEASAYEALSVLEPAPRQRAWSEAVRRGAEATRALSEHTGAAVWTSGHSELQRLIAPLGAWVKPTGAGGGDLALACAPSPESHAELCAHISAQGWELIEL